MKIKLHANLGTNDFPDQPLQAGIHEVDDSFAARLIALRLADPIIEAKAKIVAATEPDVATMQGAPSPVAIESRQPAKSQSMNKPKTEK